jgi:hypothetical protein
MDATRVVPRHPAHHLVGEATARKDAAITHIGRSPWVKYVR